MPKDDEMPFTWEDGPDAEIDPAKRGERRGSDDVPGSQRDQRSYLAKQADVTTSSRETVEQGNAPSSTINDPVVSAYESDILKSDKERGQSAETSGRERDDEEITGLAGSTSNLATADMIRHAFEFLEATFGKKWVERASLQGLRFKDLAMKLRLYQKRFAEAQNRIKQNEQLIAQNRIASKDYELKRAELEDEKEALKSRLSEIAQEKLQLEQKIRESEISVIHDVIARTQEAFGTDSPLYAFIRELPPPIMVRIGYACVFSLPWIGSQMQGGAGATVPIHALVVLANAFLRNVTDFDGPERGRLLNLAAEHLSKVSQMFSFHNEEGQLFNSDRHAVLSGFTPSAGAKVTRMASFFVLNTRTKQPFQKAEVTL